MLKIIPRPDVITVSDNTLTVNSLVVIKPEINHHKRFETMINEVIITKLKGNITNQNFLEISLKKTQNQLTDFYEINIQIDKIIIKYDSSRGIFYSFQTLKQIILQAKVGKNAILVPTLIIKDKSNFAWRGMHLDVSRHFFTVNEIKKYLDYLALYKFNKFHWHLSDDQGWRIEIEKYPNLTEVGSKRIEKDGSVYAGYYSKQEIKEIVNYAAENFIEIIPEIDIPGHSQAIMSSYPELCCFPADFKVMNKWGTGKNIFCAANDKTYEFLKNVFKEIIDLFPGKFIHIGGDECIKTNWQKCAKCQNLIKTKRLENVEELQSYFMQKIVKFLAENNRKIIGWDEILDGAIDSDYLISIWRGDGLKSAEKAFKNGNKMILCPNSYLYFDWKQSHQKNAKGAFGVTELKRVYNFPINSYPGYKENMILGAQGNVWTEFMVNFSDVEYLIFPRLAALAELLWSKSADRDYNNFKTRLKFHYKIWKKANINFYNCFE